MVYRIVVDDLGVEEISTYPVWEFDEDDEYDQYIHPVRDLPVKSLDCRLVGTRVRLANGQKRWAMLSNIEPNSLRQTRQFLTIGIEDGGKWFHLARYHDVDYEDRGPEKLAGFLGMNVEMVFPLSYDITSAVEGDPAVLKGEIPKEPAERLTDDQRRALALGKDA